MPPTSAINKYQGATLPLKALSLDSDFGVGGELNLLNHYKATSQPQDHRSINNRHSAGDWLYNVFSLPKSSVLKEIRSPVLTIAAWSGVVSVIHRILQQQTQSTLCQRLARNMCIGATPHSFLVSSLGLLLVFRTNSAYQRFNEGRKIWENILSISRNISRTISLYGREVGPERKQRIVNLVAAFPYLLRHHIRPGCLCESEKALQATLAQDRLLLQEPNIELVQTRHEGDKSLGGVTKTPVSYAAAPKRECWVNRKNLPWCLLDRPSLRRVAKAQNRPLWVCDRMAREIMDIPYGPNFSSRERLSLLSQIDKLTNTVGQCERIHQTAVPLNYARHSLRSLTLWLVTLPFAMVKDMGLLTGPVMGVMAWLLFGVYQIGYSIEDPFQGSLRLSILCDAIRNDVIGNDVESRDTAYELDWESTTTTHSSSSDAVLPSPQMQSMLELTTSAAATSNLERVMASSSRNNDTWNSMGKVP